MEVVLESELTDELEKVALLLEVEGRRRPWFCMSGCGGFICLFFLSLVNKYCDCASEEDTYCSFFSHHPN